MLRLKFTIVGESSTGKTSIIHRLLHDDFTITESTIGASFLTYDYNDIKYEIWDTAGGERFMTLVPMYFRNSDVIAMVFDLSNLSSIDKLKYYFDKLRDFDNDFRVIIIGNKSDLITESKLNKNKMIIEEKIKQFSNGIQIIEFICISAKTGNNFDKFKFLLFQYGEELKLLKESKFRIDLQSIQIVENNDTRICEC
jgi:small GTP-binding protein